MPCGIYKRKYIPEIDRILSKVEEINTGCLIFKGYTNKLGYGVFHNTKENKTQLVHRYVYWYYYKRPIEEKLKDDIKICHRCDNPSCCNPTHLFEGTDLDNNQDMIKKGRNRQPRGKDSGVCKLSEEEVLDIYHSNKSYSYLADTYKICRSNVAAIKKGKSWSWLTNKN